MLLRLEPPAAEQPPTRLQAVEPSPVTPAPITPAPVEAAPAEAAPAAPAPVEAPSPEAVDAGVIEEARRRQRSRRRAGTALASAALVIAGSALLIGAANNGNSPTSAAHLSARRPLKLTFVHGHAFINGQPALAGISPSLQAGNVGVCISVVGEGSCNGPPPTTTNPIYGGIGGFSPKEKVGPEGEIDTLFTGPIVAAVRVAHFGTFKAQHVSGLPPGAKEVIFYRPPGARGSVLPPGLSPRILQSFEHARRGPALTETLLDASGREIPVSSDSQTFTLPNSYWQGTQAPPANGRCAMSSSFPGATVAWGQVTQQIAAYPDLTAAAWLTCLHMWFSAGATSYETAILLNAKSPGSTPAPLWGAQPVPRHPGIVEIPPIEREFHLPPLSAAQATRILTIDSKTRGRAAAEQILRESERRTVWDVLVAATVARRVGPAWLLVREGPSLAQRIAFLQSLHVTRMALH
jgi:hypothetical protein